MPIPPRNRQLTGRRARRLIGDATFDPSLGYGQPTQRLPRDWDFLSRVFVVCDGDAIAVMLSADPFAYLSHASAIALHGLGPKPPAPHISTPERVLWTQRARRQMEAELGEELDEEDDELPFPLVRAQPAGPIRGIQLQRHETRKPLEQVAQLGQLRVSPIGAAFRDSLTEPAWCGGMQDVVRLWRTHAHRYLDAIIDAISQSEEKIVRVRAGYLLEEMLGLVDPRIELWLADAQRGSSRRLDSTLPYAPRFSARWMLSINVDDPNLPATQA